MPPGSIDADDLELVYALGEYPQPISTFVDGEMEAIAPHVQSIRVFAMGKGPVDHAGPGVRGWQAAPKWTSRRYWLGNLAVASRFRSSYVRELSRLISSSNGGRARAANAYAKGVIATLGVDEGRRDSVHFHAHFASENAVAARAAASLLGATYSVTVHAFDIFTRNPYLQYILSGARLVVAISEFDRAHLQRHVAGLREERLKVIHVGVPAAELAHLGSAAQPGTQRAVPHVVAVGRLVEKKGMRTLVRAIARLVSAGVPVRCDIAGEGPERARLEADIRMLSLEELVRLHGELTPRESRRLIAGADVFALACEQGPDGDMDGIPVALMEAMACRVPVVSTRLSGIPELVEHGRTGLLADPGDVDGLSSAIAEVLRDPKASTVRAEAAFRLVADEFDQKRNAEELLRQIVASRSGQDGRYERPA